MGTRWCLNKRPLKATTGVSLEETKDLCLIENDSVF